MAATTSLLVPTKATLTNTKYTPSELADNQQFEAWFLDTQYPHRFAFILALWEAYRDGLTEVTHNFNTYEDAAHAASYLSNTNTYNYLVTGPEVIPSPTSTITVSWLIGPA